MQVPDLVGCGQLCLVGVTQATQRWNAKVRHVHRGRHTKLLFAAGGLLCQFECSNNVLLVESELWAKYGRDL